MKNHVKFLGTEQHCGPTSRISMREACDTHQNILACDQEFAITGLCQLAPYPSEQDKGYHNEIGTLFSGKQQVQEITQIALGVLTLLT